MFLQKQLLYNQIYQKQHTLQIYNMYIKNKKYIKELNCETPWKQRSDTRAKQTDFANITN